jgi:hypothetical protein
MATGSYEESLSMEGIPGHHGAKRSRAAFTSGLDGHRILRPVATSQKETYGQGQSSSKEASRGARKR